MAFCQSCGSPLQPGEKFCQNCGAKVEAAPAAPAATPAASAVPPRPAPPDPYAGRPAAPQEAPAPPQTPAAPASAEEEDIKKNKGMAVLAYLGFLVLIPLFACKASPFARFHTGQGLLLMFAALIIGVAQRILATLLFGSHLWPILNLVFSILMILCGIFALIGIVHAARGQYKGVPIFGKIRLL